MTSKDALSRREFRRRLLGHRNWSLVCGLLAVAGAFLAGRWLHTPQPVSAQVPRTSAAPNTRPARPAAPAAGNPVPAGGAMPRIGAAAPSQVTPAAAKVPVATAQAAATPAAVVNGEPITREQLANECLRRFGQDVLESLVNKQLIWQECQKQGIKITEQDVADEVERMAAKFGMTTERWLTMLREEREINPDQYRREIVWPTIALRRLAAGRIEVTDAEIRQAFESEFGPSVRVRMIALLDAAMAAKVQAEAAASPDKFPDLAKQYSQDPNSAASRGVIPPIRRHLGEPELERVAFSLKKGEVSPVIHVANQYLILRCDEHLAETYIASQDMPRYEQRIHDQIRDNKMRNAAADMFQTLQKEARVTYVFTDPQLSAQMPGVAATINGGSISMQQLADESLVRHGKDVLEGEINRRLLDQELRRRQRQVTQPAIDEEIRRAAESYSFTKPDGTVDVQGWLKSVTETEGLSVELYVRDVVWPSVALKTIVGSSVEVTADDLQKGFESNYGERVEVLAIVVSSQRQANQVWDMARNNPTEQFFGELAQQYSVEPISRANQGKVPPIRRHGGQPVVEEEAFRLQPGELSGIVAVGDKFIIMRCLGRTKPVVNDFGAVKGELVKDIQEKKLRLAMATEFDRLRETAQIDNFLTSTTQSAKRTPDRSRGVLPAASAPRTNAAPQKR